MKNVCCHKLLIFCVKNRNCLTFRLQGVKLGLKSVMFLCRTCLSMYFSPKKVLCLIYWIFYVLTHELNLAFVRHGGTKAPMTVIQRHCISIGKELFIKPCKCFWYKPSHSSSLISCYSLSNSRRHSANADMIADMKRKIIASSRHFFANVIFSATSKVQNYQNKTREKSLNPKK